MATQLFLLLFIIYGSSFYIGKLLQKIRIPWIFTGLLLGAFLSMQGTWFTQVFASNEFSLLAELGVLFLLFIIGFSIDLKSIVKQGKFIAGSAALIILGESLVGSILMYTLFDLSLGLSILVATSFATVGEVVLLPILDEFKLTKKKLGQTILGIGVLDDVIEVIVLLILSMILASRLDSSSAVIFEHILLAIFLVTSPFLLRYTGFIKQSWRYAKTEHLFVGAMMMLFLFIMMGSIIDAPELAAIAAGIAINHYLPDSQRKMFESEIRTMAYGFFAPLFFVSVGYETDFSGLGALLPTIIFVTLATSITKVILTYTATHKRLGSHGSIVAGVALSIRLSTSIIVIKLLFDNGLIPANVYTTLIGSTIVFKFINPPLIAHLIQRWNLTKAETGN